MSRTVTAIPATKKFGNVTTPSGVPARRRVAAYARVSTEMEEQTSSYEAQIDYYTTYIRSRNDWQFAGMYSDEGISGTSMKRREGFQTMIDDALAGKIDLISHQECVPVCSQHRRLAHYRAQAQGCRRRGLFSEGKYLHL